LIWTTLTDGLTRALREAGVDAETAGRARIELAVPRDPAHGDWTCNIAMAMARELKRPPRQLAEALAAAFPRDPAVLEPVEVAGPGFLNFRYAAPFVAGLPQAIRRAGEEFGKHDHARGLAVMVEYVSANPTGPLNVVNARAAAVGATLVRLLRATGHRAEGEFYVNDAGNQVDLLGASVRARLDGRPVPELGYQGAYVGDIAEQIRAEGAPADEAALREAAIGRMLAWQQRDLADYGAEFATWFRESSLHRGGHVAETLEALEGRGMTYRAVKPEAAGDGARDDHDGDGGAEATGEATWLRTSRFGDDKDRVLVKSGGAPTYLLPDVAYHRSKRARGFRHAIDLWGPDHHGYIARMKAALLALGLEPDFLEVLIVQQVNLLSGGQPVKMSKRAGEFVTLRDLMDDVGADAAKFFFLMRGTSSPLDFDLDLAKQQNDENPAFYVQYAHARICSILRYGAERGLAPADAPARGGLAPEETALVRLLATFPEVVRGAAMTREPQRIPAYLVETAAAFHRFYHQCRVVTEDLERSRDRLALVDATRIVLRNGLALMGVGAPERMERAAEALS
jgi:arginyl-tRNA synthetase